MLRSYEATYEKGRLRWIREKPDIEDGEKVIVVVEARPSYKRCKKDIQVFGNQGPLNERQQPELDRQFYLGDR